MNNKMVMAGHLGFLLLSALLAWFAFASPQRGPENGDLLLDASVSQVEKIEFKTDKRQVIATSLGKGKGFELTVFEEKPKPKVPKPADAAKSADGAKPADAAKSADGAKPADAAKPADGAKPADAAKPADGAKPAAAEPPEVKIATYRAASEFDGALEKLLPLRAVRELGTFDADKLAAFGLQGAGSELLIQAARQTVRYRIGKKTFGGQSVYLRAEPAGPVYLVNQTLLQAVDFQAPRYMERRIVDLDPKALARLSVDCGALGSRTFKKRDAEAKEGQVEWVPVDEPQANDELYTNWTNKLIRLSVSEYMTDDKQPEGINTCKFNFSEANERLDGGLLIWSEQKATFARTDFTRTWVQLQPSSVANLISDLPSILGNAPKARPQAPAPAPAPAP